jgi:hypothetical protein
VTTIRRPVKPIHVRTHPACRTMAYPISMTVYVLLV